ncbi:unnamed protein product [Blepharisma stoltei]|uniref:Uncharacterized protein n=1 Tax=Blepharisma stoltei TaxID=1481888 RepID=A0AAU9ILA7_9CILI|nr:unnamed protein product [Blepharisma stoltei]
MVKYLFIFIKTWPDRFSPEDNAYPVFNSLYARQIFKTLWTIPRGGIKIATEMLWLWWHLYLFLNFIYCKCLTFWDIG